MTVAELIEILRGMDPNARVLVRDEPFLEANVATLGVWYPEDNDFHEWPPEAGDVAAVLIGADEEIR